MRAGHASPYAGSWYPGDAAELGRLLDELFERSAARTGGFTYPGGLGFVVPHAGPVYSGTVAAAVYRTLARQRPERVLVIGFPHRGRLRGVAWPEADSISTPLGEVRLDREFLDGLGFPRANQAAVCDH